MHYFEPQIEIMDSSVSEIVLVPSGLRPSGKSTISATSESIISTRDTQCMAYLYIRSILCLLFYLRVSSAN